MEQDHPEWITPYSPTQRVNETPLEGFERLLVASPCCPLANTYSKDELNDFINDMHKLIGKGKPRLLLRIEDGWRRYLGPL